MAAPEWFTRAVAQPASSHWARCEGAQIHYLAWNEHARELPGLLFVHGMLGHAHWWDFIAPFFTDRYRVCAMDFSGMGDSEHRPQYRAPLFAAEIAAVLGHAGLAPAAVVGHSFGGGRLVDACATDAGLIRHAIVLDTPFHSEAPPVDAAALRPNRVYPTEAQALEHFRLMPAQSCPGWMRDHITQHSMRRVEQGWTWSFDPALRHAPPLGRRGLASLPDARVPVDFVYGGASTLVSAELAAEITRRIPQGRGPIEMPEAGHHMMLDQPLALVGVLKALLA